MFETILGNEQIKAYLTHALKEQRLPQTLLFAGPEGVGKSLFAKEIAKELLGSEKSPDFHILAPEGKSSLYAIDTLREMIEKEHEAPFQSPGKVFLLNDVERMQPASANALLKTLEEPSPDTTFILLTSQKQEILPTILSRCITLQFQPVAENLIQQLLKEKGHPESFAKLCNGSVGRAFELAEHPELESQRKTLFQILEKRPSYPELSFQIDQLAEKIEASKEEDPLKANRHVEFLFSTLFMWYRDQYVKQFERPEWLFFPNEKKAEPPKSLAVVEKAIEKAQLGFQRNLKLSVCLKNLFLELI